LHLERLRVELDKYIPFLDAIVVVDENASDLPGDTRSNKRHIPIHVRVVC
jgi:hypothetical protein